MPSHRLTRNAASARRANGTGRRRSTVVRRGAGLMALPLLLWRRWLEPEVPRELPPLLVVEPHDLQVLQDVLVRHPQPAALCNARAVRLELRRAVLVRPPVVEQRPAVPVLFHVHELVDHVEVDVPRVARLQVVRGHEQVAVLVGDAHVAPARGEELNLDRPQGLRRLRPEDLLHGLDVLEPLEEVREPVVLHGDRSRDRHTDGARVEPLRLRHGPPERRGPLKLRRASLSAELRPPRRSAAWRAATAELASFGGCEGLHQIQGHHGFTSFDLYARIVIDEAGRPTSPEGHARSSRTTSSRNPAPRIASRYSA